MNVLNNILNNKKICLIILFLTALTLRVSLINIYNQNKIFPDGTGYHRLAVNLVKGNGYSNSSSAPFIQYYFREPGYPVFLAIIYKIYTIFGGQPESINDYNLSNYSYTDIHNEITLVKYFQAVLDSITLLIFYLSLLLIFKKKFAFFIVFILALYYPLAIHVTYILRETLQAFLSMVMVYSFMNFLFLRKYKWLILFSVFWAFSNLTFQVSIILALFLFIFLLIYSKKIWYSVKVCFITGVIMLLVSSPWLIRTYNYYPDWRIIKSFGTSFTPEYRSYISALFKANYYSYISDEEFHKILMDEYINVPAKEKFNMSFNGKLKFKVDSINKFANEPFISKRKVIKVMKCFKNSWFSKFIIYEIGWKETKYKFKIFGIKINNIKKLIEITLSFIIGLLSITGMIFYYRRIYPLLLIFTMYISVFFIIGTENRRMLPAQPFILMFSILAIFFIYFRFIKKNKTKDAIERIFSQDYFYEVESNYKEHKRA